MKRKEMSDKYNGWKQPMMGDDNREILANIVDLLSIIGVANKPTLHQNPGTFIMGIEDLF